MSGAPAHDDPPNRPAASVARLAGPLVDLQVVLHRAVAFGRRVVVHGTAAPLDSLRQYVAQSHMEPANVFGSERVSVAQGMETSPPQGLVGVDVPDPGEEILVHQQRLEATAAASEQLGELLRGELVGEWLGPRCEYPDRLSFDRQAVARIAPVEAHPPELADIAKSQLPAVRQRQNHMDVAVLRRTGGHHE